MGAQWKAKHKDLAANARGRLFGKLAKDIMIAARHGADPAANSRLRLVVEQARKVSMHNQTPNTIEYSPGDRRRVLRSVVKRETALTYS